MTQIVERKVGLERPLFVVPGKVGKVGATLAFSPANIPKTEPTHPVRVLDTVDLRRFLGVSEKTLERRLKQGDWSLEERLRLEMVEGLLLEATRVLGSPQEAVDWLLEPIPALGGKPPLERLDSIQGYEAAKESLLRGAHGMF